ncbi:MAG: hypothetical protein ACW99U_20525 [Candidatus Thorarchaeota archaeon]|jgi:hypothetical protein
MPTNNYEIVWDPTNKKWTVQEDGAAAYDLVERSTHELILFNEIAAPAVSGAGESKFYMDSTSKKLMLSENGGAYQQVQPLTTKGDIQTYSTTVTRLAVGADGTVLEADSGQATGLKWGTKFTSPLTTKGDLFCYAAADARLAIGADYNFLIPLASESTGLKWFLPPYCELYRSGSRTMAQSTEYSIVWNGTTADAWNMHPGNSATITIPYEGVYLIQVQFDIQTYYGSMRLRLYPSVGTQHISQWGTNTLGGPQIYGPQAVFHHRFTTGSTFYVIQWQRTGGNRPANTNTTFTRIRVIWIGPYN